MHFTPAVDHLFADHRNIVFRLACDHARRAAGAGGQVNRHAPAGLHPAIIRVVGVFVEHRKGDNLARPQLGPLAILLQRAFHDQFRHDRLQAVLADGVNGVMVLHARDDFAAAG